MLTVGKQFNIFGAFAHTIKKVYKAFFFFCMSYFNVFQWLLSLESINIKILEEKNIAIFWYCRRFPESCNGFHKIFWKRCEKIASTTIC